MRRAEIIFNGKEIVARLNRGDTPYLLVTFVGALHEHEAEDGYLLDDFVERHRVSCLGITTRLRGFYLGAEMQDLLAQTETLRSRYTQIICIGLSMGGYAAIKYTAALRSTHALAFSPLYSLDAGELELQDEGQIRLLNATIAYARPYRRPEYATMAPRLEEVTGQVHVVFDGREFVDAYSATMLQRKLPVVTTHQVDHLGHLTQQAFFVESVLLRLIDALRHGGRTEVSRIIASVGRRSEKYVTGLLLQAARDRPRMSLRALRSPRLEPPSYQAALRSSGIGGMLAASFIRLGEQAQANTVFRWIHREPAGLDVLTIAPVPDGPSPQVTALLVTHHGTFVCRDHVTDKLIHVPDIVDRQGTSPVFARLCADGRLDLFVMQDDTPAPITVSGSKTAWRIEGLDGFRLAIAADDPAAADPATDDHEGHRLYLSAELHTPQLNFRAPAVDLWEILTLLPVCEDYPAWQARRSAALVPTRPDWFSGAISRVQKAEAEAGQREARAQNSLSKVWMKLAVRNRRRERRLEGAGR